MLFIHILFLRLFPFYILFYDVSLLLPIPLIHPFEAIILDLM